MVCLPLLGALCLFLLSVDAVPVVLVGIGDRLLALAPAVVRRGAPLGLRSLFARGAGCLGAGLAFCRSAVACHFLPDFLRVARAWVESGLRPPRPCAILLGADPFGERDRGGLALRLFVAGREELAPVHEAVIHRSPASGLSCMLKGRHQVPTAGGS